ncbi:hypothetical protein GA0074695_4059 [Micromonospora viridifaciens]|uniref:Uncharacterized protein n=1 Tax=Micromonospora viridifaciens TaxID=1881 RepID=A0A1C4YBB9_MICVI|nr:hypothetical protein [Micromonospora viridifaciens]SCF18025.1 hypothetical protein GA0074695_4059 [Micromonospora viridifaciens]
MRTLMSGEALIDYAQIYVYDENRPDLPEMHECFAGQANGLCGAAVPGFLFLVTGLRTGEVAFVVELHDESPPLDDGWEEIVEASFRPAGRAALVAWGEEWSWPLDLAEVDYRVRYCGAGMDEAHDQTRMDGDVALDRYLLQFWPAPARPDRVVKQTSANAAYWHASTK